MKTRRYLVSSAIILSLATTLTSLAVADTKSLEMKPLTVTRGQYEFGPMTGTVVIAHEGTSADVSVNYAIQVGKQGRVFQRSSSYGDTNGPWLHLELLDKEGNVVARSDEFIAPTWACSTITQGSRQKQVALSKSAFDRVASFRLISSGGGWREEGC